MNFKIRYDEYDLIEGLVNVAGKSVFAKHGVTVTRDIIGLIEAARWLRAAAENNLNHFYWRELWMLLEDIAESQEGR